MGDIRTPHDFQKDINYGQRLFPHIIDSSADADPSRLILLMAKSSDTCDGFTEVTIGDVSHAINFMAWWIEAKIGGTSEPFETIAYMGVNDVRYCTTIFGAVKSSKRILLPSTRNSIANNISLFESTKCKVLLCAAPMEAVAKKLQEHVNVKVHIIPSWDEIMSSSAMPYPYDKTFQEAQNEECIILHTSGSTGDPKPIVYNHAFLSFFDTLGLVPKTTSLRPSNMANLDQNSNDFTLMCFPLFHLVGLYWSLSSILYGGTLVLGPAQAVPSGHLVNTIMEEISIKTLVAPPSILEDVVKGYGNDFETNAKTLQHVFYGGGPLAPAIGNLLANMVPHLAQIYGQTEIGMPNCMIPAPEDWRYFQWHPTHSGIELEPTGDDEGHHELVISRDPNAPFLQPVFCIFPHLSQWRTKDLFQRHPEKSDLWLFKGRRDDTIVLSNAEKFNPLSTEGLIQGHDAINGALIVGTGRFQVCLIIELKEYVSTENVIESVWPTVEKANSQAPGHGQIDKKLIMLARPEKPFRRAGKGTIMRYFTTMDYTDEIEELYSQFETGSQEWSKSFNSPHDPVALKEYLRASLKDFFPPNSLSDDSDFYAAGLDSLKTSQLANRLHPGLSSHLEEGKITSRIIYENPTINKLSAALFTILNNVADSEHKESDEERISRMEEMISEFTTDIPQTISVALTGSTGSLGGYILDSFLSDRNVKAVYCLDRSADAEQRYLSRNASAGRSSEVHHLAKIHWLQVDLSQPLFGLSPADYNTLSTELNSIVHNAWKVDFNHTLSTFKPQIRGLRNLIDFTLESPSQPSLLFVSSISAVGHYSNSATSNTTELQARLSIPEKVLPLQQSLPSPMGYGESKYVSEAILSTIARRTGSSAFTVLRIGQIAGPVVQEHTRGSWNENEWFPSLVKSSQALGMLPMELGSFQSVDWIPVDLLAGVVVELVHDSVKRVKSSRSHGPEDGAKVFNLVNPERVSWSEIAPSVAKWLGSKVELVSLGTWLHALKKLDAGDEEVLEKHPALKIVGFFESLYSDGAEAGLIFETEGAQKNSEKMRNLGPISEEMMGLWMSQWGYSKTSA